MYSSLSRVVMKERIDQLTESSFHFRFCFSISLSLSPSFSCFCKSPLNMDDLKARENTASSFHSLLDEIRFSLARERERERELECVWERERTWVCVRERVWLKDKDKDIERKRACRERERNQENEKALWWWCVNHGWGIRGIREGRKEWDFQVWCPGLSFFLNPSCKWETLVATKKCRKKRKY